MRDTGDQPRPDTMNHGSAGAYAKSSFKQQAHRSDSMYTLCAYDLRAVF